MKTIISILTVAALLSLGADHPKPQSHQVRELVGWKVKIDDRLFEPANTELGEKSIAFLENKLRDIAVVVAPERLEQLRRVTIVVDLTHGELGPMQYHPSADWLRENGYSTDLERCVHVPQAADLSTSRNIREQPWVILHELAHAYHDQVLGFDDPRVQAAYDHYLASGRGETALLYDGTRVRHYGLTDQKEFFAEMTEAYFGSNDFFPFNRAELQEAEPEIYRLMKEIWEP